MVVLIPVGGYLIGEFERRHDRLGLGVIFFTLAVLGMFSAVPDTEQALTIGAAAVPLTLLAWPKVAASVGIEGAYAAVAIFLFVTAAGGQPRASIDRRIGGMSRVPAPGAAHRRTPAEGGGHDGGDPAELAGSSAGIHTSIRLGGDLLTDSGQIQRHAPGCDHHPRRLRPGGRRGAVCGVTCPRACRDRSQSLLNWLSRGPITIPSHVEEAPWHWRARRRRHGGVAHDWRVVAACLRADHSGERVRWRLIPFLAVATQTTLRYGSIPPTRL